MNKLELAANPSTPPHILEELSRETDYEVLGALVSNPNISVILLEQLSLLENSFIQENVAKNPNTPSHILDKLSKHKTSYNVIISVAKNINTSPQTLFNLSKNNSYHIRIAAIKNPSINPEVLQQYFENRKLNEEEQLNLSSNSSTPPDILHQLSNTDNKWIKIALANNSNTSIETLANLLRSSEPYVVELSLFNIINNRKYNLIASIKNTEALTNLSKIENWFILDRISQHPLTPPDILSKLFKDYNQNDLNLNYRNTIREYIAANPSTPFDILESEYQKDKTGFYSIFLIRGLSKNINTPSSILQEIYHHWTKISYDREVHKNLAGNISTPNDLLEEMKKYILDNVSSSYVSLGDQVGKIAAQTLERKNPENKIHCYDCLSKI